MVGLNVGGISSKFRYNILSEYIKNYHIVLFSETKLSKIPQSEFPDFNIFSFKQKTRLHGLSVLLKNDYFPYVKKLNGKSKCVMWLLLGSSEVKLHFIIGAVYVPGYDSKFSDENDFDVISEDVLAFREKFNLPFILKGDFNARTADCQNSDRFPRQSQDQKIDTYGRKLLTMCKDLGFIIVNGCHGKDSGIGNFTCHKKNRRNLFESVVDYCIVSESMLSHISDFYVDTFDRNMSDVHSPICLDIQNIPVVKTLPNISHEMFEKIKYKSTWKTESKSQYQNSFSENKINELHEKIMQQQQSPTTTKNDIEKLVTDLTAILVEPAQEVGVCKKIRSQKRVPRKSPNKSWFNSECENKRKEFFKAKNALRKAKTMEEKTECKTKMNQESTEYRQLISSHQKEFSRTLQKNLRELHRHHPKEYWGILNKASDTPRSEPKVSLTEFESHFKNLNNSDTNQNHTFDPSNIDLSNRLEFNLDFTRDEIESNIKSLKNNKSEGLDFVKNEYIQNCPPHFVDLIVKIFNLILRSGHVPYDWCIGLIVPIYKKKGSQFDPNNYRGITLLSCVGKLFTMCINVRLTKFVFDQSIIGEEQAAFREDYSTLDHVFVLNELINIYLQRKKRLYCCFIDYKKAFDTINRCALWGKVIANGINGKILKVVYNMYENAKSCVKQQSMISGLFSCNMGVRQGENLSPLLFAIFLNDFEASISEKYSGLTTFRDISSILSTDDIEFFINMYTLLYADDTLVFAESPSDMQLALDAVSAYCNVWGLSINKTKTKVVIFSRGKVKKEFYFKIGNLDIGTSSDYCYLGVLFNFNGKLNKAIEDRLVPARKAMFGLNEKAANLLLPPDIHIDLFEKMITPIFLYGSEVWGYGNIEPIELFYRKFIKRVLGVGKSAPNCFVYGEVGKYPIAHRVYIRMLSFWIKISEGKTSKLSSLMYKIIYKLHLADAYNSPWLLCIKKILCDSGNPNFWYEQDLLAPKTLMKKVVHSQLENQYLQFWQAEMNRNRKCITYRIFKDQLRFEPYLKNLNFIERRALSCFRSGCHQLPIAASRYTVDGGGVDTICDLCDRREICDEFHLLFICKFFQADREKYLKKTYFVKPSTLKMYTLFNSGPKHTIKLAKFIRTIMSHFNKKKIKK